MLVARWGEKDEKSVKPVISSCVLWLRRVGGAGASTLPRIFTMTTNEIIMGRRFSGALRIFSRDMETKATSGDSTWSSLVATYTANVTMVT